MTVDRGLQPLAIGLNIASPILAATFVALRLYSRYFVTRNLACDDAFMLGAMVLAIAMTTTIHFSIIASHYGLHFQDILKLESNPVLVKKYNYASQILYNIILAFVKNAMLVFFLRLGRTIESLRHFIIILLVINNLMMVAIFIAVVLQCVPINKTFYPEIEGTCIDTPPFFISTAGLTILTDILVLIIPTWLLWDLRMKPRKKIATVVLLSLGLLVTSISIYRMYNLQTIYYGSQNPDPTYSISVSLSTIEVNLAIIAACGPAIKPLVAHVWPNLFERDTTDRAYNGWANSLSFGDRLRTYSANATAAKLGSSFGSEVELQQPFATKAGKPGRSRSPLVALDEEEGDDERVEFSTVPSIMLVGQARPTNRTNDEALRDDGTHQGLRSPGGITRQVTVEITYSPSTSHGGHRREL